MNQQATLKVVGSITPENNVRLSPPKDKQRIAAALSQKYEIGIISSQGMYFADMMAACRRLITHYLLISDPNSDASKVDRVLGEDEAYKELLHGTLTFFTTTGRTQLSLTDFITDVPEILQYRGLVASLRH